MKDSKGYFVILNKEGRIRYCEGIFVEGRMFKQSEEYKVDLRLGQVELIVSEFLFSLGISDIAWGRETWEVMGFFFRIRNLWVFSGYQFQNVLVWIFLFLCCLGQLRGIEVSLRQLFQCQVRYICEICFFGLFVLKGVVQDF